MIASVKVLGIKVKIILPRDPTGKVGPKRPIPDQASVVEQQAVGEPSDKQCDSDQCTVLNIVQFELVSLCKLPLSLCALY